MKHAMQFSAGGIVVDQDRVLAVRPAGKEEVWTFPKGLIERGEKKAEAALREVREETGYQCEMKAELPASSYWFRDGETLIHKTVYWFLMSPQKQVGEPDSEIGEIRWLGLSKAGETLSYKSDKEVLMQAIAAMKGGTPGGN